MKTAIEDKIHVSDNGIGIRIEEHRQGFSIKFIDMDFPEALALSKELSRIIRNAKRRDVKNFGYDYHFKNKAK